MKISVAPVLLALRLSVAVRAGRSISSQDDMQQNCGLRRDTADMEERVARNVEAVRMWQTVAANQTQPEVVPDQPKVAFVFLIPNDWPLEGVWADWLAGQDKSKYKVVIHSKTGSWRPKHDIFTGSELHRAVPASWCRMADALLEGAREALKDESVVQVVTMCRRTAPVKPFEQVYNELTNKPTTRLCIDGDWKNRGMPFSYTWARRDAELFTQNSQILHSMFIGVHNCDVEDFFVVAAKLAKRPYEPDCVTWSGWDPRKGFALLTNGRHYVDFLKDPLNKMATQDWCAHPVTVEELSEKSMNSLLANPEFLFARKLSSDSMKINSDEQRHVTLQEYLKQRISQPAQQVPQAS